MNDSKTTMEKYHSICQPEKHTRQLICYLARGMECSSPAYSLQVFSSVRTKGRNLYTCETNINVFMSVRIYHIYDEPPFVLCKLHSSHSYYKFKQEKPWYILPVAYNGTECVRKPPAATTQRVWRRRTMSRALSGVSTFEPLPLAFFTGANSSSREI